MRTFRSFLVATGLLSLSACGPTVVVDGFRIDQAKYVEQRTSLYKRAAFDLKCPEAQLKITVLATYGENGLKQAGVTGCDQRATYVTLDFESWVMNANNGQAPAEQAPR
jgi:hypothetical protein